MWGVLLVLLLGLLPLLVRWAAGLPVLPGVEPYVIANGLHQAGVPPMLAVLFIVVFSIGLLAMVFALVPRLLSRTRLFVELSDVIRVLLVLSPAWIAAAAVFPSHALVLGCLAWGFVLRKTSRAASVTAFVVAGGLLALMALLPSSPAGMVEFGALNGYGLFGLILAAIGGAVLWENKARSYFIALGVLVLVVVSFFVPVFVVLGSVAVAVIGGLGLVRLWHRKWGYALLRTPTLVVCCCGLLFSAVVSVVLISHAGPSAGVADVLQTVPRSTVLTEMPPAWVAWWSDARVSEMPAELRAEVWSSRNVGETRDILDAWNVSVILVTPEMRADLWNNNEDGLLFLMRQSKTFKSVSQGKSVEVWVYTPST